MQRNHIVATLEARGETAAIGPVKPGGMRLIDEQHRIVPLGNRGELIQRRTVAVHAVETLDGQPDAPSPATGAPRAHRILERPRIVVRDLGDLGAARARALVGARMRQGVEDEEIAALRQCREQGVVGDVAAAEEKRSLGVKERRGPRLERLVLRRIASQQPDPPAPTGVPRAMAAVNAPARRGEAARPR